MYKPTWRTRVTPMLTFVASHWDSTSETSQRATGQKGSSSKVIKITFIQKEERKKGEEEEKEAVEEEEEEEEEEVERDQRNLWSGNSYLV